MTFGVVPLLLLLLAAVRKEFWGRRAALLAAGGFLGLLLSFGFALPFYRARLRGHVPPQAALPDQVLPAGDPLRRAARGPGGRGPRAAASDAQGRRRRRPSARAPGLGLVARRARRGPRPPVRARRRADLRQPGRVPGSLPFRGPGRRSRRRARRSSPRPCCCAAAAASRGTCSGFSRCCRRSSGACLSSWPRRKRTWPARPPCSRAWRGPGASTCRRACPGSTWRRSPRILRARCRAPRRPRASSWKSSCRRRPPSSARDTSSRTTPTAPTGSTTASPTRPPTRRRRSSATGCSASTAGAGRWPKRAKSTRSSGRPRDSRSLAGGSCSSRTRPCCRSCAGPAGPGAAARSRARSSSSARSASIPGPTSPSPGRATTIRRRGPRPPRRNSKSRSPRPIAPRRRSKRTPPATSSSRERSSRPGAPGSTAQPVPVTVANARDLAVAVPAGRHRVEIEYDRRPFRRGVAFQAAALLAALAVAAVTRSWSPTASA